jgi:hypothetical protein
MKSKNINNDPTFPVIVDTGCSFTMTFDDSDFQGEPVQQHWGSVQTTSVKLLITACGMIKWTMVTESRE